MNAHALTIHGIASALTMRHRPRGVAEIVAEVFGPTEPGRNGRRAHQHRRMLAMWAGRQLNLTDREMSDQVGFSEIEWTAAHERVSRLRSEYADWKALTDAVMAKMEDE